MGSGALNLDPMTLRLADRPEVSKTVTKKEMVFVLPFVASFAFLDQVAVTPSDTV